jgi:hypothetical protein
MKMRDGLWQSKSGLGEDIKRGMEMHQKKIPFSPVSHRRIIARASCGRKKH